MLLLRGRDIMKIVIINGSARKGNVIMQMQEMNLQKM